VHVADGESRYAFETDNDEVCRYPTFARRRGTRPSSVPFLSFTSNPPLDEANKNNQTTWVRQRDMSVLPLSLPCSPTDASRPLNRSNADQRTRSQSVTSRDSDNFPSLLHSTPRLQHREICLCDLVPGFGVGCATTCSMVAVSPRSCSWTLSTLSHGTA
jgi:hypothetical protein